MARSMACRTLVTCSTSTPTGQRPRRRKLGGRAKAYEEAADRIEEAAKRSSMSVADAEKALASTGVDPTIMSVDKLTSALETYQTSGAGAAEASAALARDLAAEEAAADAARSRRRRAAVR